MQAGREAKEEKAFYSDPTRVRELALAMALGV